MQVPVPADADQFRRRTVSLDDVDPPDAPASPAALAKSLQIPKARAILSDDHYGWFERIARGTYALTPKGHQALIWALLQNSDCQGFTW